MEMAPTTLTSIPPSLLPAIFHYLEAEDLHSLVELTGDSSLRLICTKFGGVTELRARSGVSAISTIVLGRFPAAFAHLAQLRIELDVAKDYAMTVAPLWVVHLPATLKEIHFSFDTSVDVFLEPLEPEDDDFTRFVIGIYGNKPLNVAKYFPNLHILKLESLSRDRNGTLGQWKQEQVRHFLHHLPRTLSRLQLPGWCYRRLSAETPRHWPQFYNMPALRSLKMHINGAQLIYFLLAWHPSEVALSLKQELHELGVLPSDYGDVLPSFGGGSGDDELIREYDQFSSLLTTGDLLSRVVAPLMHLQSLTLDDVPINGGAVGLQRLEELQHLALGFSKIGFSAIPPSAFLHFSLPPNLVTLKLNWLPIGTDVPALLQRVPLVTDLTVSYQHSAEIPWLPAHEGRPALPELPGDHLVHPLTHLPPDLTQLSLKGSNCHLVIACPLPVSLTRLKLKIPISNFQEIDWSQNIHLTSLRHATDVHGDVSSYRLPPNLVHFEDPTARFTTEYLQTLPQSLRSLRCSIKLSIKDKELFAPVFSESGLHAAIRQRYTPHLSTLQVEDITFDHELETDWTQRGDQVLEYRMGIHFPPLFSNRDSVSLPKCQVYDSSGKWFGIFRRITDFPSSLTELRTACPILSPSRAENTLSGLDALFAHEKCELQLPLTHRESKEEAYSLPKGLTSLDMPAQDIVITAQQYFFSPLLSNAPLLTKFALRNCTHHYLACFKTLPKTITDLTIIGQEQLTMLELPKDWMPNLVRLHAHLCDFHYNTLANQLNNMTYIHFSASHLVVPGDVLPEQWTERDSEICGPVALQRHCLRLLPPRLRRSKIKFAVDWTLKAIQGLPRGLKYMTITAPGVQLPKTFGLAGNNDFGLHLPSESLTFLDIAEYPQPAKFSKFSSLPKGLLTLKIQHSVLNKYADLPSSLTTLDLTWSVPPNNTNPDIVVSQAILSSLPRGLKELQMQAAAGLFSPAVGALAALPPALLYLRMPLSEERSIYLNTYLELPKSLVHVSFGPHVAIGQPGFEKALRDIRGQLPNVRWISNGWKDIENVLDGS